MKSSLHTLKDPVWALAKKEKAINENKNSVLEKFKHFMILCNFKR